MLVSLALMTGWLLIQIILVKWDSQFCAGQQNFFQYLQEKKASPSLFLFFMKIVYPDLKKAKSGQEKKTSLLFFYPAILF